MSVCILSIVESGHGISSSENVGLYFAFEYRADGQVRAIRQWCFVVSDWCSALTNFKL